MEPVLGGRREALVFWMLLMINERALQSKRTTYHDVRKTLGEMHGLDQSQLPLEYVYRVLTEFTRRELTEHHGAVATLTPKGRQFLDSLQKRSDEEPEWDDLDFLREVQRPYPSKSVCPQLWLFPELEPAAT
jgi:hypothetical protein